MEPQGQSLQLLAAARTTRKLLAALLGPSHSSCDRALCQRESQLRTPPMQQKYIHLQGMWDLHQRITKDYFMSQQHYGNLPAPNSFRCLREDALSVKTPG